MTKSVEEKRRAYISKIRAKAGRKGGIAKAANRQARQAQDKAQLDQSTADTIKRLELQNQALSAKLDHIIDNLKNIEKPQKAPPRFETVTVVPTDAATAKQNFWGAVAADNDFGKSGKSSFDLIRKENAALDELARKRLAKRDD